MNLTVVRRGDKGAGILAEDLRRIVSTPASVRRYHAPMQHLCKKLNGIGLAACQVGIRENFFFMARAAGMPKLSEGGLVVNPRIMEFGSAKILSREGCLSLPTYEYDVVRSTTLKVRWQNVLGHWFEQDIKGMAAIVFQHEYDHLGGVTLEESNVGKFSKNEKFCKPKKT